MKNHILILSLAGLLASAPLTMAAQHSSSKAQPLDKIIVIVNEDTITQSQYNKALAQARTQIKRAHIAPPKESILKKDVLNHLIDQSLLLQTAKNMNITVSDAEVNKTVSNIAQQNHTTLADLKTKIPAEMGISFDEFKTQIKNEMIIAKLEQQTVGQEIVISDKQLATAMAKAKSENDDRDFLLSDIMIPLPDKPTDLQVKNAFNRAQQINAKLKAGKSFDQLAALESEGPNALQGGSLGWRKIGDLPDVFVAPVHTLKVNQTTDPIRTPNGIHILKLDAVKQGKAVKIDSDQIKMELYRQEITKKLPEWLKKIRDTAYIKIEQ